MKKTFLTLIILLLTVSVCSAKKRKKRYSLRDSLRGGLSVERTCYDVHFYDLTVDFNLQDSSIVGDNVIAFHVLSSTSKIQLDLFQNLSIDSVVYMGDTISYTRVEDAFFVEFPAVLIKGVLAEVQVFYHGKPIVGKKAPWDGGFVWSKDDEGRPFVGVACEGVGASCWWPNKDHLSDKPDSMLLNFTVPNNLKCVSNGVQQFSKQSERYSAKTHYQWKVQYPIVNYNVTFYIGDFEMITDYYVSDEDSLLLQYHVLDYNLEKATKHFEQVKPMLSIYEELYGRYPFWKDGYKLVDAPYLGMEHQSAIAYGNQYQNGYLGRQMKGVDFDYVIVHETGHEYWGNNITMNDLADMWIHEAFCTYSEALFVEKKYNYETMINYLIDGSKKISNKEVIIPFRNLNQMGSRDMYLKGSMLLHLVRVQLDNDSLWFVTLKGLQNEFAYKSLSTDDALLYLKSNLGKKVMPYFEHYLYNPALPKLVVQKMKAKGEYIIRWADVPSGFKMKVELKTKKGEKVIEVDTSPQRFVFDKIKSKEPEVSNLFGAFTVHYK